MHHDGPVVTTFSVFDTIIEHLGSSKTAHPLTLLNRHVLLGDPLGIKRYSFQSGATLLDLHKWQSHPFFV